MGQPVMGEKKEKKEKPEKKEDEGSNALLAPDSSACRRTRLYLLTVPRARLLSADDTLETVKELLLLLLLLEATVSSMRPVG